MKQSLTPRQLAQAIGVSESSMKRWVDEGRVRAARTAGGHRRIPLSDALRFIRESSMELVAPESLGLPELRTISVNEIDRMATAAQQMTEILGAGDDKRAHALVMGLYLGGESIASIIDGPIRVAMEDIGERWQHSADGLLVEHRATDIVNQVLNQIRVTFPAPQGALRAVGGTLEGDPYLLATLAAACALTTEGIDAIHLGPETPASSLILAARQHDADLVWVSVNVPTATGTVEDQLIELHRAVETEGRRLMVGGKGVSGDRMPATLRRVPRGSSIGELVGFAKGLQAARAEEA